MTSATVEEPEVAEKAEAPAIELSKETENLEKPEAPITVEPPASTVAKEHPKEEERLAELHIPSPAQIGLAVNAAKVLGRMAVRRRRSKKSRHVLGRVVRGVLVFSAGAVASYLCCVRPLLRRWGATDEEVAATMPGDDLTDKPNFNTTRAITIEAKPDEVWPWLVQLGQGRGGFYSYTWLENLMGLKIENANQIIPEFQNLQVGDLIPVEPKGTGLTAREIEPNRLLVLAASDTFWEGTPVSPEGNNVMTTMVFALRQVDDEHTRLIVRWRARWDPTKSLQALLMAVGLELGEFIMTRKMMRGIKERAEMLAIVR